MTLYQASNFLVSCILVGLGFAVISVILVFLNNIFHKFWKPIEFGQWASPVRYPEQIETEKGISNEHGTGQTKT